jgi:hypothetical protein
MGRGGVHPAFIMDQAKAIHVARARKALSSVLPNSRALKALHRPRAAQQTALNCYDTDSWVSQGGVMIMDPTLSTQGPRFLQGVWGGGACTPGGRGP